MTGARWMGSIVLLASTVACTANEQSGTAASPAATPIVDLDAEVAPIDVAPPPPPPPSVVLEGVVTQAGTDAGINGAIVVLEVGGLGGGSDVRGADGALLPTLEVDPFIHVGAVTRAGGLFSFTVPAGTVGLHTLAPAFVESTVNVSALAGDGSLPRVHVPLEPLVAADAAPPLRPRVTDVVIVPTLVTPGTVVALTATVTAGSAADPLSGDVFVLQSATGWAGPLVPPSAAIPGAAHPDGRYDTLVPTPEQPGVYTYTVVAASLAHAVSDEVSVAVTVTATGDPPTPDAGVKEVFLDGGGLPDGRH